MAAEYGDAAVVTHARDSDESRPAHLPELANNHRKRVQIPFILLPSNTALHNLYSSYLRSSLPPQILVGWASVSGTVNMLALEQAKLRFAA